MVAAGLHRPVQQQSHRNLARSLVRPTLGNHAFADFVPCTPGSIGVKDYCVLLCCMSDCGRDKCSPSYVMLQMTWIELAYNGLTGTLPNAWVDLPEVTM